MREIKIGILGLGVVGSGTVRILQESADAITQRVGARLVVHKIAVRNLDKPRDVVVDRALLTDNPLEVIDDPEIEIVAELVGGVEPCHDYILRAIQNGKNIVTANKELMAKAGQNLLDAAAAAQRDFFLEGSVAGGIPIIAAIKESLAANHFQEVMGIVNGTTNYILTKMTEEGADFAAVLAEAQRLGYAEADPTSDVDGHDAAYKLAILSSLAFNSRVVADDVGATGIRHIQARDIAVARELGYRIKLVAVAHCFDDGSVLPRVHPALLPESHPLASVNGVFNAVLLRGDAVGEVMFYGRGAGSLPTGSAVVGDLIACARNILSGATGRVGCTCFTQRPLRPEASAESRFYIRLHAKDRPKGLAEITGVFGDFDVSISSLVQRIVEGDLVEICLLTHRCHEPHLRGALDVVNRLPTFTQIQNWFHVEE